MLKSFFTRSIRSRICAWTVTSSAVVGSSAIRMSGLCSERHRDHRALAHAARVLVRIVAEALLRLRDADRGEQLDDALARLLLRDVVVCPDRLDDLVADPVHRVQAREGVLEDHRELLAADLPELVRRKLEEVLALEEDLPGEICGLAVDEAERGQAGDALARAGLADDAERLAASTVKERPSTAFTTPSGV